MNVRTLHFPLLVAAFGIAAVASVQGIRLYDGDYLSSLSILAALIVFVGSSGLLWTSVMFRKHSADWLLLSSTFNGEYTWGETAVRGTASGSAIFARIDSASNNGAYLDPSCEMYSSSRRFFTLTLKTAYRDRASWRLVYQPRNAARTQGGWHVISGDSFQLARALEQSGAVDLFSEWDSCTVVKCAAETGELTLRYPAPHSFFCPTPDELEDQVKLLQRVADLWRQACETPLAA